MRHRLTVGDYLPVFLLGVACGLILSLWWRAAQIQLAERDAAQEEYFKSELATLNE